MAAIPVPSRIMLVGSGLWAIGIPPPEEFKNANVNSDPPKNDETEPPLPKRLPKPKRARPPPPPHPVNRGSTPSHRIFLHRLVKWNSQLNSLFLNSPHIIS